MSDLTSFKNINVLSDEKQKPTKEFPESLNELEYMEKNHEEYKVYHNVDKMIDEILNEDDRVTCLTCNKTP